ncbi:MAG: hypothetical protein HQL84_11605 [Magnetococcales bacterium]|nr:hypothetical protein [Magnetococcales bacterium]MBF0150680.1 hypothetical protein [Magnetococcales bacterium]MBF0173177.1 hypothetical protein [Magnetococcales bacterium]MBF0347575.1 hypothetical protein [Magnetococcales bacterium]MBF0631696.1 hypothetical protein [Magnetococcales bacterium]
MDTNMMFGMWVALALLVLAWFGGHPILRAGGEGFERGILLPHHSFRMGIDPGQPPFSSSDMPSIQKERP